MARTSTGPYVGWMGTGSQVHPTGPPSSPGLGSGCDDSLTRVDTHTGVAAEVLCARIRFFYGLPGKPVTVVDVHATCGGLGAKKASQDMLGAGRGQGSKSQQPGPEAVTLSSNGTGPP